MVFLFVHPSEKLLSSADSKLQVLSSEEVEGNDIQLQINPALSYMRLMNMNELDFAIKDLRYPQWLLVYDNRSCVDMVSLFDLLILRYSIASCC